VAGAVKVKDEVVITWTWECVVAWLLAAGWTGLSLVRVCARLWTRVMRRTRSRTRVRGGRLLCNRNTPGGVFHCI
jgi:hypothetical protein